MAKRFERKGNFEVTIENDNSVSVVRHYNDCPMEGIREMVNANNIDMSAFEDMSQLGMVTKILAKHGNLQMYPNEKKVGTIGEYTVAIYPAAQQKYKIDRKYSDSMKGLREAAEYYNYPEELIEPDWSEYIFACHICDHIQVRNKLCSFLDEDRLSSSIEKWLGLEFDPFAHAFKNTINSVLVIDKEGYTPLKKEELMDQYPDIHMKYINLALASNGDYTLFCKLLSQRRYNGLLLDNIDRIPDNADREFWEEFVRFALKREHEVPIPNYAGGDFLINFDEMHIAARCMEMPEFLEGKSLQAVFITE